MKIDKGNPVHWLLLLAFFVLSGVGAMLRLGRSRRAEGLVVLYGHKLNGNLLALHQYMVACPEARLSPVFLTMDRSYRDELRAAGVQCCWASGVGCARLLAKASALASDHGLHAMQPWHGLYRRLGMRFVDVWHGIPFKGFDADDFRLQHRYDEIWVASNLCRHLYVERFGFRPERVVVTGYARTDRLLKPGADKTTIRRSLGLPSTGPLMLFAPTWKQDATGRSLYPFGCQEHEFLGALSALAARDGGSVVLRSHLNSGEVGDGNPANVYGLPASRFPDTESILLACDVLVCDWSSIAFDFLLLDRPTVFLDVEPPFRKGFSLGPEYRFGPVVDSLPTLLSVLEPALSDPQAYWRTNGERHREIRRRVYGGLDDGGSAARCVQRLSRQLKPGVTYGSSQ